VHAEEVHAEEVNGKFLVPMVQEAPHRVLASYAIGKEAASRRKKMIMLQEGRVKLVLKPLFVNVEIGEELVSL